MYLRNKLQGYTVERRRFVDGKLWWCLILRWADDMSPIGDRSGFEGKFRTHREAEAEAQRRCAVRYFS